jgi:hypothetical protein
MFQQRYELSVVQSFCLYGIHMLSDCTYHVIQVKTVLQSASCGYASFPNQKTVGRGLFNDSVSSSRCIASIYRMINGLMKHDSKRSWPNLG